MYCPHRIATYAMYIVILRVTQVDSVHVCIMNTLAPIISNSDYQGVLIFQVSL